MRKARTSRRMTDLNSIILITIEKLCKFMLYETVKYSKLRIEKVWNIRFKNQKLDTFKRNMLLIYKHRYVKIIMIKNAI